ncbi:MAG: aconitase X [Methanosarcinales archaeon]
MELAPEEEHMLEGKEGKAAKKSMEILIALGKIFGAKRLINIKSVQVAGVSYHNLGDAGLDYLTELSMDGKVKVPTTLNPAGMDLRDYKKLGISDTFAKKQLQVIDAFKKLGISSTATCTPYLVGNKPKFGDHIAWSESSAVCFANSVLGARTNREGGPSALASALTGKTPEYGMHLDENRHAQIIVNVESELKTQSDYSALGYAIGTKIKNKIPYIKGIKNPTLDQLKNFSASIATYGGTAIYHIENVTPNNFARDREVEENEPLYHETKNIKRAKQEIPKKEITITYEDLKDAYDFLNDPVEPDFISIGCPHASLEELREIATLLKGKKTKIPFWIATARKIKEEADKLGYTKIIEDTGAILACDTCMAVAPLKGRFRCLMTNSAKACYYGRGSNNFKTRFASLKECINQAII